MDADTAADAGDVETRLQLFYRRVVRPFHWLCQVTVRTRQQRLKPGFSLPCLQEQAGSGSAHAADFYRLLINRRGGASCRNHTTC